MSGGMIAIGAAVVTVLLSPGAALGQQAVAGPCDGGEGVVTTGIEVRSDSVSGGRTIVARNGEMEACLVGPDTLRVATVSGTGSARSAATISWQKVDLQIRGIDGQASVHKADRRNRSAQIQDHPEE